MKALTMLLYVSHALSTTLLWRSTEQPMWDNGGIIFLTSTLENVKQIRGTVKNESLV